MVERRLSHQGAAAVVEDLRRLAWVVVEVVVDRAFCVVLTALRMVVV